MSTKKLHGVIPAVVTPFNEKGGIDTVAATKQLEYLAGAGANGLFINGTTGEGAYLTAEERRSMIKLARSVVDDSVFVCAAVIRSSLNEVLAELGTLGDDGADFAVAVPPYYYAASQAVVEKHFRRIAEASPVPLILYNIPGCTGNSLESPTVHALKGHPNIVGLKDSSADFVAFTRAVLSEDDPSFVWIQGEDYLDAPALLMGAGGIVTGLSNVRVETYVEMYAAAGRGDMVAVVEAQRQINLLYKSAKASGYGIIPFIKAACELLGRGSRRMRQEGVELSDAGLPQVREALDQVGLL